jgi:hypothetical protein
MHTFFVANGFYAVLASASARKRLVPGSLDKKGERRSKLLF